MTGKGPETKTKENGQKPAGLPPIQGMEERGGPKDMDIAAREMAAFADMTHAAELVS